MTTETTEEVVKPEPRKWIIRSGPSKYDFFESLEFRKQPTQLVTLQLQDEGSDGFAISPIKCIKTNIFLVSKWVTSDDISDDGYPSPADGMIGGHEWKFVGSLHNYDRHVPNPQFRNVWVIGHYSTKTRQGKATELPLDSELFRQLFTLFF